MNNASHHTDSPSVSLHELDQWTSGAFSAPTSAERVASLQAWLATSPSAERLQLVYKELSHKDKGAAKLLRERLDEIKRDRAQSELAQAWAERAQGLLGQALMNLADAMAWQRDAAKAGAPLSKEPLAGLKTQLADRVRATEDLQHRVQVQREAAVLLAQRIEVLSTKSWVDAVASQPGLEADVQRWQQEAQALAIERWWPGLEHRFQVMLEGARSQLLQVWEAFGVALQQAKTASEDAQAPLPPVPVWADELRASRSESDAPVVPEVVDPALKAQAEQAVREVLAKLEIEVAEGHGKASAGAANTLRAALASHAGLIDSRLDKRAHRVLSAATELESWQRWRADQIREELVSKARALVQTESGQAPGGRKLQEQLKTLREAWKLTDQGGVPNHALWKKFDSACNEAHKLVEAWLNQRKAEAAAVQAQRQGLIDELKAWAAQNRTALDDDWRGFARILHTFAERWRQGGHLSEKQFASLHTQWKSAMDEAAAPLKDLQAQSLAKRQQLIEEAKSLTEHAQFRIEEVKALQQRWQSEAHAVPLDRRHEQKLWDAFRKPIDQAFERRSADRAKVEQALGARDRLVLQASDALKEANASGDAQKIKAAMDALQQVLRGDAGSGAPLHNAESDQRQPAHTLGESAQDVADAPSADPSTTSTAAGGGEGMAKRPVVAMRGDDRPGAKISAPAAPRPQAGKDRGARGPRAGFEATRRDARPVRPDAPRLGEPAFRSQRDAMEQAELALRKLAAHAHGEALTQLLLAWQQRDANKMPSAHDLGKRLSASDRAMWIKAVADQPQGDSGEAMLRLEMAAQIPSPAEFIDDRRQLQLLLLTRRNDPSPSQTWTKDVAQVLAQNADATKSKRLQNALKVLLKS